MKIILVVLIAAMALMVQAVGAQENKSLTHHVNRVRSSRNFTSNKNTELKEASNELIKEIQFGIERRTNVSHPHISKEENRRMKRLKKRNRRRRLKSKRRKKHSKMVKRPNVQNLTEIKEQKLKNESDEIPHSFKKKKGIKTRRRPKKTNYKRFQRKNRKGIVENLSNKVNPRLRGLKKNSGGALLRGKRLSHYPHQFHFRQGRRRSLFGYPRNWAKSVHHRHDQIASSMRNRIHNHIARTRQQWLNSINPHTLFMNSIPSFPEIPEKILPTFPSLVSHVNRRKNTIDNIPKSFNRKSFVPTHRKKFGYGRDLWHENPTTPSPRYWTPKNSNGHKQFKVTRNLSQGNDITTSFPSTESSIFKTSTKSTKDVNKIWRESREEVTPSTNSILPKELPKKNPVDVPKVPTFHSKPEIQRKDSTDKWKKIFIPYGNDITKGKGKGVINVDKNLEKDWEWIPLDRGKNDVNYSPVDEDETGDEENNNEVDNEEHSHEDEEEEEEEEEKEVGSEDADTWKNEIDNEDRKSSSGEHGIEIDSDIDHCLECPSKRRVHAPRGQDYVPLFIPSPKYTCRARGVLRYHVEVGPGSPKPGSLLGEGHYFINVSILGGSGGRTPVKACTYDYEVQVYKCPPLPYVSGGKVECSAGQALGSKCYWKCDKGKKLVGSPHTTCIGPNQSPLWSNNPPICEEAGCPIPKSLEGISLTCTLPIPHESIEDRLGTMELYPKGSTCQVRCKSGFVLENESTKNDVKISKCLSNGKWFPDIRRCCKKTRLLPQPVHGECKDINVQMHGPGVIHLIPPKFFTASGKPAHVWCDLDSIRSEGRHCRTCKAHDKARGLMTSCRQCINVSTRIGCPSIRAPRNGNLECRNTAEGDIHCKIICKEGYLLPPFISSGNVRCPRGMSLWDFQSYRGERLPPCVLR